MQLTRDLFAMAVLVDKSYGNQGGYDQGGYDQGGYDQGGYDQGGYDQGGYGDFIFLPTALL